MFKIFDGRDCFYQWDIDRKLIVADSSIKEVHFANFNSRQALTMEVCTENGQRLVDVPNVLLQESWRLSVYAYGDNHTKYEAEFSVKPRQKPDDYVYTDEEIAKWSELDARIDQIEENGISDEAVDNAVQKYLAANPIEIPVESVNGKTGAVELTAADVGALPADTVIPDTTGLATEDYVDEKFNSIEIPEVDLTGYATEEFVNEQLAAIDIPDNSIALASGKTITDADAMAQIKTIFTNGLNPAVYVDGVPVAAYASVGTTYLYLFVFAKTNDTSAMEVKQYEIVVSSTRATISSAKTAKIKGYATEQYVKDAIAAIEIPEAGGDVDLTNYYTKSEVDAAINEIELTPGPAGQDGYTPVKGVDYFDGKDGEDYVLTEADKQEIAGMVEVSGGDASVEEVHVGTEAPTDENIKLWVNPDEESSFALKSDLANFQTASQVQTAINNALSAIGVAEEGTY